MKKILLIITVLGLCVFNNIKAADAPVNIAFPPPKIVGTPVPIKVANLEKPGKQPAIMAPAGTINVAAGKKVTSSDAAPIVGELSSITDGDKVSDDGYFVELADGKQWVQVDLGKSTPIYGIALWHYHGQQRVYYNVIVQISDDEDFLTNVKTVFNNDRENALGLGAGTNLSYIDTNEGKIIPVNKISGRYVRFYSQGNTSNSANHYIEIEVYGTP